MNLITPHLRPLSDRNREAGQKQPQSPLHLLFGAGPFPFLGAVILTGPKNLTFFHGSSNLICLDFFFNCYFEPTAGKVVLN